MGSVAPPIQSRVYHEISSGMEAFNMAVNISDVPFPFQFAQLFNLLVLAFTGFIPIYSVVSTDSVVLSALIAFVVFETIFVINKVALELETPFGTGVNDISVKDFHARFLEVILEITTKSKALCKQQVTDMALLAHDTDVRLHGTPGTHTEAVHGLEPAVAPLVSALPLVRELRAL